MDVSTDVLQGTFGQQHFGTACLGDRRRTARLIAVADQLLLHPGGTFPQKIPNPADLDAFYRLMAADDVTHASVLAPHTQLTHQRMRDSTEVVLILHDSTVLDYSGLDIPSLGQIGDGHGRGYYAHNSLAITAGRRVLGLAHQILHTRRHVPPRETRAQRRDCPERESRLWRDAVAGLPPVPEGHCWVDIADRAADLTEFLEYEQDHERFYVVRSQHDRWVYLDHDGQGSKRRQKLHRLARKLPSEGTREVSVSAQAGQPARTTTVAVAWSAVRILPPRQRRGREQGTQPLAVWVIRVWEVDAPAGATPLEWILLTNLAVNDWNDACQRIDWYACRPVVEEYHKAMKTGCGIEQMQFTMAERLEPAIALLSVLALTLLQLRDAARCPEAARQSATEWLPPLWVKVIAMWRYGAPARAMTLAEFFLALARLGGHQNRPSDGPPGWLVLWRGWTQLQAMVQGIMLVDNKKCRGT
jgi:Transposase DNA-binding